MRALVFSAENLEPIRDGTVLFTCRVQVAPDALPGTYPLLVGGTVLSDPTGSRICGPDPGNPRCTGDRSGSVTVR